MATQLATTNEAPKKSLLVDMAGRYGMEPKAFADTLRNTVVPLNTSNEEFAAFLIVAREYDLNPILKEIYAFPKRGGGIQPIVSIDGWCNLINSNPQLNGIEFDDHLDAGGKVSAITCRIWRKDREKPIMVTEYMAECVRSTDTWKQYPRRMLRHKALIQCARYAFGLAGIVDPDEAERMGAVSNAGDEPPPPPADPVKETPEKPAKEPEAPQIVADKPPAPPSTGEAQSKPIDAGKPVPEKKAKPAAKGKAKAEKADEAGEFPGTDDPEAFRAWAGRVLATVSHIDKLEPVWDVRIEPHLKALFPPDQEDVLALYRKREGELNGGPA